MFILPVKMHFSDEIVTLHKRNPRNPSKNGRDYNKENIKLNRNKKLLGSKPSKIFRFVIFFLRQPEVLTKM